jgi:hypothetical protein
MIQAKLECGIEGSCRDKILTSVASLLMLHQKTFSYLHNQKRLRSSSGVLIWLNEDCGGWKKAPWLQTDCCVFCQKMEMSCGAKKFMRNEIHAPNRVYSTILAYNVRGFRISFFTP